MIRGLPPDSATRMALNDREPLWTRTDYILADLVDATQAVAWCVSNRDVPKTKQGKFPQPYPRPGMEVRTKKSVTADMLLAHRERTRRT